MKVIWLCLCAGVLALSGCGSGGDAMVASDQDTAIDSTGLPAWAIGPFTRYEGNPIMRPEGLGWESLQVLNPGVVQVGGQYKMIYRGIRPVLLSKIGLATSDDGINWTRYENNPVINPDTDDDKVADEDPRLFYMDGTYYAFFTGFGLGSTNLLEATSTDLIHWTKVGIVVPGTKNGAVVTDPHGRPHRRVRFDQAAVSAANRARNSSRCKSAVAPGDTRAARLDSGVLPSPALAAVSAALRYASRNGTPAAACSIATSVAYIDGSIAARMAAAFHCSFASRSGSSASASRPRWKPWKIAPFENCRSRW